MGTTSSDVSGFKEIQLKYNTLRTIDDVRYGHGRVMELKTSKDQVFLKEINSHDDSVHQKLKKSLDQRIQQPHPNLINILKTYSQEDSQLCGAYFKLYAVFEYVEPTLEQLIEQHKIMNISISEDDMWLILQGSVDGLCRLQQTNVPHQSIRPTTISMNPGTRQVKLCDPSLLETNSSFTTIVRDFQGDINGAYLSPLQVLSLEDASCQPKHNSYKSDVFSLGMNLLHAGTLDACDQCYYNGPHKNSTQHLFQGIKLAPDVMYRQLDQLERYYSQEFCQIIRIMLDINEASRPDFLILEQQFEKMLPSQAQNQDPLQGNQSTNQQTNNFISFHQPSTSQNSVLTNQQTPQLRQSQTALGQDVSYTLNHDQPDLFRHQKPRFQPSSPSPYDENIGNEITQPPPDSPPRRKENIPISMISQQQQQYQPITARSPISNNRDSYFQGSQLIQNQSIHLDNKLGYQKPQEQPQSLSYLQQQQQQQPLSNGYQQQQPQSQSYLPKQPQSQSYLPQSQSYLPQSQSYLQQQPQSQSYQPQSQSVSNQHQQQPQSVGYQQQQISQSVSHQQQLQPQSLSYSQQPQSLNNQAQSLSNQPQSLSNQQQPFAASSYVHQTNNYIQVSNTTSNPNKYDYLYDNKFNPVEKVPPYQDDLSKKYATKMPNKFDDAVKAFEFRNEKEQVVETYQNGSRYEGEKLNGLRHGRGRFDYQDGGVYDGEWCENKMHGRGTLYYASAKPAYEGQWIDDKFEGEGTLYNEFPQALMGQFDCHDMEEVGEHWTKYSGGFHDDNKEGMGNLILSNGDRFQGYFVGDMVSGPGKYFSKNGQVVEGHWWHNKFQY